MFTKIRELLFPPRPVSAGTVTAPATPATPATPADVIPAAFAAPVADAPAGIAVASTDEAPAAPDRDTGNRVGAAAPDTDAVAAWDASDSTPAERHAAPVVTRAIDASVDGLTAVLRHRIESLLADVLDADARQLLESIAAAPTAAIRQLPAAAQRALALTQRAEPPIAELTVVFEEDPTLAQALLTQANSSMYGGGRSVLSVRDALQRLGVSAARNVLMGHTVSALLCRPGGKYAQMVDDVWQHMVRTAPIARRIASAFNADAEEAFGLGLLHDVGKLVIFDRLTTLRIEQRRELVIPPADLRMILRMLHEPLGGLAAHNWNLGDAAAAAVATHHRDPVPKLRDALSEVLCVAEAADISSIRGEDFDLASTWDRAVLAGSAIRVERALMAA